MEVETGVNEVAEGGKAGPGQSPFEPQNLRIMEEALDVHPIRQKENQRVGILEVKAERRQLSVRHDECSGMGD
jgi:hypothetical protein